jgi:glucosamine--fructose-6-phosphate aminotransferase (isomerizing)
MSETRNVQLVHDGEIVAVTPTGSRFISPDGAEIEREVDRVDWSDEQAEKGGYETFMLKEIHEQADAVAETIADRLTDDGVALEPLGTISDEFLKDIRRVVIVGCGTAYHAGLVGRYAIEWWSRLPVEMDIASEFRYRNPVIDERDLVIGITQSGETADTLAAMRLARERGAKVLAVTNIQGSQATRDSDGVLYTRAGLEIGVAATKTFVAQVAAMYMFALKLAQLRGTLEPAVHGALSKELRAIPQAMAALLEDVDEQVRTIAEHWKDAGFFLYLGRHVGLPICLEGALKLKEVSYIPTDAYAAGEMKHGPIALLDERTPVVCVATDSPVLEKVLSNIAEVRARGAHVIAVATEGSGQVAEYAEEVVEVPRTDWLLQPLLAVIPLQLVAYYIARARGLNVDQPRNLAKTVTVE